jgi:hypothetical protein
LLAGSVPRVQSPLFHEATQIHTPLHSLQHPETNLAQLHDRFLIESLPTFISTVPCLIEHDSPDDATKTSSAKTAPMVSRGILSPSPNKNSSKPPQDLWDLATPFHSHGCATRGLGNEFHPSIFDELANNLPENVALITLPKSLLLIMGSVGWIVGDSGSVGFVGAGSQTHAIVCVCFVRFFTDLIPITQTKHIPTQSRGDLLSQCQAYPGTTLFCSGPIIVLSIWCIK